MVINNKLDFLNKVVDFGIFVVIGVIIGSVILGGLFGGLLCVEIDNKKEFRNS